MGVPIHHDRLLVFDTMWNQGKFRQARSLLLQLRDHDSSRTSAEFWNKLAMAEIQLNRLNHAERCIIEARGCPDYGEHAARIEGDFRRNLATWYVRRMPKHPPALLMRYATSDNSILQGLLERTIMGHYGLNDEAAAYMIIGRYEARQANKFKHRRLAFLAVVLSAIQNFQAADAIWEMLGEDANEQWRINNRFHWFMALRAFEAHNGAPTPGIRASELFQLIEEQDPNPRHVKIARVTMNSHLAWVLSGRLPG